MFDLSKVRCLIVDDEELMLQRLSLFFDSLSGKDSPFILAGQACSGQEGLELAARLNPDIVITDIRMPGMDGITMIEQMKRIAPNIKFIILTAYSEFEYAKRAIHLEVLEYIVKVPLNEEDLLRAMEKAAADLVEVKAKDERLRKLNSSISENRYRIYKQFFREVFRGQLMTRHAAEVAAGFDMKLFHGEYCCVFIEMNRYVDFIHKYPLSDQSILKYGMLNVVEETLRQHGDGLAFEIEPHQLIGFLKWPRLSSEQALEQKYREIGQEIIGNVSLYLKQSVSIGFSRPHRGWDEVRKAYIVAAATSELQYYRRPESIVTPAMLDTADSADSSGALHEQLGELLSMVHRDMNYGVMEEKLRLFKQSALQARIARHELTGWIKEFLRAARIKLAKWKQTLVRLDEDSLDFMSLEEQIQFLYRHMEQYALVEEVPERVEIAKAVSYIEQHLAERLSLQMIAEQVNLAPAYFSSLFKREMKESLVDFINRKKIESASELLKHNSYTNQELSDKVGILNEAYFCTLFKQKTGETPGQYRKKWIAKRD